MYDAYLGSTNIWSNNYSNRSEYPFHRSYSQKNTSYLDYVVLFNKFKQFDVQK